MEPERWRKIDELFHLALGKQCDERKLFLAEFCAGDEVLQKEVEDLISSHEQAEEFIESPASDLAAEVLGKGQSGLTFGDKIGPYEIQSVLGIGGMGEVYLASDTRLGRQVALKILPPRFTLDPERVSRFEKEARAASALNHPNIVTIHEIGHFNSARFIVTEFVEGHTLRQLINEKPFTLNEALNVTIQVAVALASAHTAGIIHRDIKPENIMLRADGYVKILDFGLAKLTETGTSGSDPETPTWLQSNPGLLMGTVQYMSPEQARREHVDLRTDVWSLGIVLYELLAGNVPFSGKTPSHVMVSIMEDELPALTSRANVPAELDRVVTKALRKNKRERYQTAQALGHDLKELKRELQLQDRLKPLVETDEHLDQPTKRDGQIVNDPVAASANTADTGIAHPTSRVGLPGIIPSIADEPQEAHHATSWRLRYWLAAAFVIVLFTTALYVWRKAYSSNATPIRSIAVLPFRPLVADQGNEAMGLGMTDNLIMQLSKSDGLVVRAFNGTRGYGPTDPDAAEVGQRLGVDAVLVGSIQVANGQIRVTVRLIRSSDGAQLWADKFDEQIRGVFSIQDSITERVAVVLNARLGKEAHKRYTKNVESYELYLIGRLLALKLTPQDDAKALEYFQRAIEKDPSNALAYAGISITYRALAMAGEMPPDEVLPKAKEAALKAIEIDDTLAEGHSSLGSTIFSYDWDWAEAEKQFVRALDLDPNSSMAHRGYADFLARMERRKAAQDERTRAREIEPLSPDLNAREAMNEPDPDKALKKARIAIDLDPNFYFSHIALAAVYRKKEMYGESIDESRRAKVLSPDQTWSDVGLAGTLIKISKTDEAQEILNEMLQLSKSRFVPPVHIAIVYSELGKTDEALAWLEKGYKQRDPRMTYLKTEQRLNNLREDPRFKDLMRRVGFVAAK